MKDFTHVANFPGYMERVAAIVMRLGRPGMRLLDLPAGNGLFADRLRGHGFDVVCGDINAERPHYVHVDMERPLPFADGQFDLVTCMEGLEHVINPSDLVRELCRVTKPGGSVVVSMPNVQNLYSRLKFLFTGVFYQFEPEFMRHPRGRAIDRGHVSSPTYLQLSYLFGEHGMRPAAIDGDKFKKKALLPLYLLPMAVDRLMLARRRRRDPGRTEYALMGSARFLLSRSLIAVWTKPADAAPAPRPPP